MGYIVLYMLIYIYGIYSAIYVKIGYVEAYNI